MLAGAIIFSNLTAGPVTAEAAGGERPNVTVGSYNAELKSDPATSRIQS